MYFLIFLHVFEYHTHFYSKSFHFFDLIFTYFSDSQFLYLQHRNSVGKNLVRYSDSSCQKTLKKVARNFQALFQEIKNFNFLLLSTDLTVLNGPGSSFVLYIKWNTLNIVFGRHYGSLKIA